MNKQESKYFLTSKKMNDALIALLEKKDFDYISVKDVCSVANVNRSTFYLHYEGMYNLLEEVIENLSKSFSDHFKDKHFTLDKNTKDSDLFLIKDEYLFPYLSFVQENKHVYRAVKNYPELFQANKAYEKMFDSIFSPILSRFDWDKKWHKYIMGFFMHGLSSIILNWIENDCKEDISEVMYLIKNLITTP